MENKAVILHFSEKHAALAQPLFIVLCTSCKQHGEILIIQECLSTGELLCPHCAQKILFDIDQLKNVTQSGLLRMAYQTAVELNKENIKKNELYQEVLIKINSCLQKARKASSSKYIKDISSLLEYFQVRFFSDKNKQTLEFLVAAHTLQHITPIYILRLLGERIGHYLANTAGALIKLKRENKLEDALVFGWSNIHCNAALKQFWQRHIHIFDGLSVAYELCLAIPEFNSMAIDVYEDSILDQRRYFAQNLVPFDFSESEHELAYQELKQLGVEPEKPRICFLGRDSLYLNKSLPQEGEDSWAYHDMRNMNIHDFLPTMQYFSQKNIYALRMGNIVKQVLPDELPYIIDASNGRVNELLDFYLPAHCDLLIAVPSGTVDAAYIKNIPTLAVNACYYAVNSYELACITLIFKKFYSEKEKRYLPFEYVIMNGIDRLTLKDCEKYSIRVEDNTPEEILAASIEVWQRIQGTFSTPDVQKEYDAIQLKYRTIADKYVEKRSSSTYRSPHKVLSSIPLSFIRQNPWFLEG